MPSRLAHAALLVSGAESAASSRLLVSASGRLSARLALAGSAAASATATGRLAAVLRLGGSAALAILTPDTGAPLRAPLRVLASVLPSLAVRSRVGDE
jgi:hypothetical protein